MIRGSPSEVGEAVLKKIIRKHKFALVWEGPFIVKRRLNDILFEIVNKRKTIITHHNRLVVFRGKLPGWAKKLGQLWCN